MLCGQCVLEEEVDDVISHTLQEKVLCYFKDMIWSYKEKGFLHRAAGADNIEEPTLELMHEALLVTAHHQMTALHDKVPPKGALWWVDFLPPEWMHDSGEMLRLAKNRVDVRAALKDVLLEIQF